MPEKLIEGRWALQRHYRQARRGPNATVPDGWDLTDTLTGAMRHFDLRREARLQIDRTRDVESEVRDRREEVGGWDADLELRHQSPLVEVYLYDVGGEKMRFQWAGAPAVVERALAPQRVAEWLRAMGLAKVPHKQRERI